MPTQNFERSMQEFVAELQQEFSHYRGPECREQERIEAPPIPVIVQPLDQQMEPQGKPFSAVLRNISPSGIGLSFGEHVEAEYVEIQGVLPSGKVFTTMIHVRHCTPTGVMIGGNFLESQAHDIV